MTIRLKRLASLDSFGQLNGEATRGATRRSRRRSDTRLADTRVIPGSGNVFVDLGFPVAKARVMALRVKLMMQSR